AQVAHTTPVYVTVDGGGFHNPKTLARYRDLCEEYLKELEEALANPESGLDRQATRHKARLDEQIAEARAVLQRLY
ncbi:MAG: hypothetical protein GY953_56760, partial [bacterium]|nr:hypothetical protein [bacterium]